MIASSFDPYQDRIRTRALFVLGVVVFAVAIAARFPSCFESFWLDELHSAWSVWGAIGDVAPRAVAGNQTPFYFWLIWGWKQAFGGSEWLLRLPSVIASSIAASVIAVSIFRSRRSMLAGVASGLVMALEGNAIFYGTELRPFAFVVLLGAIGCWFFMRSVHAVSDKTPHTILPILLTSIVAFALQPTSIGVFAWLVCVSFLMRINSLREMRTALEGMTIRRCILLLLSSAMLIPVGWFGFEILSTAWKHRTQWNSVGHATSIRDYWNAWPWIGLVIVPSSVWLFARAFAAWRCNLEVDSLTTADRSVAGRLIVVAAFAAGTFWAIAFFDIAPVFHRRYFVACLPILAAACGEIVASTIRSVERIPMPLKAMRSLSLIIAMIPVTIIAVKQNLPAKLLSGDIALVRRGEDWRQAVQWLHENLAENRTVLLSPGLVETERVLKGHPPYDSRHGGYLAFPLRGPYLWQGTEVICLPDRKLVQGDVLVLRGNREMGRRVIDSQKLASHIAINIHSFGGVQVIELSESLVSDTK